MHKCGRRKVVEIVYFAPHAARKTCPAYQALLLLHLSESTSTTTPAIRGRLLHGLGQTCCAL
eukprot:5854759-Amphidinium_carterae.1